MIQIMKISVLSHISTVNLAAFTELVIKISKSEKYKIDTENHYLKDIENEYNIYKKSHTKQTHNGKEKELTKTDRERDYLFNGIKSFLKGCIKLPIHPFSEEAKSLYEVFKFHDLYLNRLPYEDKSTLLRELLEALELKINKERIKILLLETSIGKLKDTQERFDILYSEQVEANANLREIQSASAIRKSLEKALRDYLIYVNSAQLLPNWKELQLELKELLKTIK